jgi:hypothetical protein
MLRRVGHAGKGLEFTATRSDGRFHTRRDSLTFCASPHFPKPSEIGFDLVLKLFRKALPVRQRQRRDGRLDQTPARPLLDLLDAGIPTPGDRPPRRVVRCQSGRFGAVAHVVVEDELVDCIGLNRISRAGAHETG